VLSVLLFLMCFFSFFFLSFFLFTMDKRRRTDITSKEEGQITHQKKKDR
jgi:hypothetical protein